MAQKDIYDKDPFSSDDENGTSEDKPITLDDQDETSADKTTILAVEECKLYKGVTVIGVEQLGNCQLCFQCKSTTSLLPNEDDICECNNIACGTMHYVSQTIPTIKAKCTVITRRGKYLDL